MTLARLITGEVVSGTIVREDGRTVWLDCADGRLLWVYVDALLGEAESCVRVRVAA
jgi:hypothetical protein